MGIVCSHLYIYHIYIILIARVRIQYGKIFYEHAKYFHEPIFIDFTRYARATSSVQYKPYNMGEYRTLA